MKNKKNILLILILFISSITYSQNNKISNHLKKYIELKKQNEYSVFIFFTDKGNNISKKLLDAEKTLPTNAIKRRKKLMKNKTSVATFYDIPINENYFNETEKYINKLRHKLKWLNAISAEVSEKNIEKIANLPFVKKIDIVRKGTISRNDNFMDFTKTIRNNPFQKSDTHTKYNLDYGNSLTQVEQINVPVIHDLGYHGEDVIICLMDAGFNNLEHPVFAKMQSENRILGTYDFVNNDTNVDDEDDLGSGDHGTMTLSTIGGFEEGELIGTAYKAKYILTKTENTESETTVEEDNWVAAMEWAEDNFGPDVTSTSLGYIYFDDDTGYDETELDGNTATITIGADIAASLGIIVVNSAGNSGSGTTTIGAPADGDSVLAVGAVEASGERSYFSSVGPTSDGRIKPDVMAMGTNVVVAEYGEGDSYYTSSGTSFSCPLTAGVAALLVQMVPTVNNMEIIEAMKATANNSNSPNNDYGWGIIDTKAAYEYFVPQIIHTPLHDTENFDGPYTISTQINSRTDLIDGEQKLYWRINGGTWQTETLILNNGKYEAEITGNGSEATYDYYIEAKNTISKRNLPEDAPKNYFSFSTIVDNTFPEINHSPIKEYYRNIFNTAKIIAEITDNTGIDTSKSYVEWYVNDEAQENFHFEQIDYDSFSANFPEYIVNVGDIIKYKIIAFDNATETHITSFPETDYFEFTITDRISFEQNQFSHNWNFSGNENWFITSSEAEDGSFCIQSGNIKDDENSTISINFTALETGEISFYKKVSCEDDETFNDWDYLKFSIDNNEAERWDGEIDWSKETYTIPAGEHTISWSYIKDYIASEGEDCAWIDNITLPKGIANVKVITKNRTQIFPNPANDFIYINADKNSRIEIYNNNGKLVKLIKSYQENENINISDFKSGIYICKIITDNNVNFSKFVVSK
ncbi:MAG: S8 family serine peptidase [Chlorobi bacterium]|nr:S8 family serine peptidase [Chlorobiota bacterium]